MFCGKCGAKNEDGAKICAQCGAALEETAPVSTGAAAPAASDKNKKVGIIAVAVVAVIVILLLVKLFSGMGGGASKVATKFVDSMFDGNGKAIINLLPNAVVDELVDQSGYDSKKEYIEDVDDTLKSLIKMLDKEYDKWKVTSKVTDEDDVSNKTLRSLKERYEDDYDLKVTEAKEIELKLTATIDGDKEDAEATVTVVKIGSKWYLDVNTLYNINSLFRF